MTGVWFTTRLALIPLGILSTVLIGAGIVLALQGSDPFELDGNAVDDPSGGADWENIYNPQTTAADGRSRFLTDSAADADSIFTGGGSKDVSAISEWQHTSGSAPDKDDILNAYAAAYDDGGQLMLYFGADRLANSGDAQIGFWLFRDPVEPLPDGTFSGSHTGYDLLILSNFVGGGDTSNLQVYRWNGEADPANPLLLLGEATAEDAFSVCTEGDAVCALTNNVDQIAPWPYSPKSGQAGLFPPVSFIEGGVNLSALLGPDGVDCTPTFVVETRSSQETTAQLKDFAAGSLDLCALSLEVTGDPQSKVGDPVTYTFTIENTGLLPLTLSQIENSVVGDLTAAASSAGCGTLAPGASCQFEASYTVQPGDADPLVGEVTAIYHSGAGDEITASATHQTDLFQPAIAFDILSNVNTASAGDEVQYVLTLANTSSSDSPNLTCTITDSMLGVSESVNLPAGAQHIVTAVYTVQAGDPNPLVSSATAHCQVDGFPNVLEASDDYSVTIAQAISAPTEIPATVIPTNTPEPTATPEESVEPLVDETEIALVGEGCSPGFWQGGHGRWLWNEPNDPDWLGSGTNPFTHETEFNTVFAPYDATSGMTVFSFVRGGGGPMPWRKAARNVVAGYLNASYGLDYPFTPEEVAGLWADAVSGSRTFMEVHEILGAANNLGCDL